jgi:DNA-binding transcriptional LysR family regulator
VNGEITYLRPRGRLDCSDGEVLHDWCLTGLGIAWRSTWEVAQDVAAGTLVSVLEEHAAPPNGVYALFPQARHLPLRLRLWIEHLKQTYGRASYWKAPARASEAAKAGA